MVALVKLVQNRDIPQTRQLQTMQQPQKKDHQKREKDQPREAGSPCIKGDHHGEAGTLQSGYPDLLTYFTSLESPKDPSGKQARDVPLFSTISDLYSSRDYQESGAINTQI